MHKYFISFLLPALIALTSCRQETPQVADAMPAEDAVAVATPAPTPTPEPTPEPTPTFQHDPTSVVAILGYHRFEDKPRDSLALKPEDFRAQMQKLKDQGITVIPMEDFLAWKRGEKNIPARSAVITIDDGYNCSYHMAWPILKEFGYPFTMFVYMNYIDAGGRSITWQQLEEMRDAGVDIGSHSVTHASLKAKKGRTDAQYAEFLNTELKGSKDTLEQKLGIRVLTHAFPYGQYNDQVLQVGKEAGYEALFTVYGKMTTFDSPPMETGRFIVLGNDNDAVFNMSLNFASAPTGAASSSEAPARLAAGSMITQPANGETIHDPNPTVKVNLSTLGEIAPESVEMRISGFGVVPATYDPETKNVSYQITRRLVPNTYSVIVSAMADKRKVQTRWDFQYAHGPAAQ